MRAALAVAVAAASLACAAWADAHELGLSLGDYRADGASIRAELTFARAELPRLAAGLDADSDGVVSQAELDVGRDALQGALVGRVQVSGDDAPCPGTLDRAELIEGDALLVRASFRCATRPHEIGVTLALLQGMPPGHRHLVRAEAADGPLDTVLTQRLPTFAFAVAPCAASPRRSRPAWTLPVCLAGLLARRAERSPMLRSAALFALGALLGAALPALGLHLPGGRALAFAAGVSLVYVGIDPLLGGDRSALLALPFGAAHGLSAGVPGVAPGELALRLAELAGLIALAAAILVLALLRLTRAAARGPRLVSALVAAAGLAAIAAVYFGPS